MSRRKQTEGRGRGDNPFVHRLTSEQLSMWWDASAEVKLQRLEEADAFVRQFVSAKKLCRWKALLMRDVKNTQALAAQE